VARDAKPGRSPRAPHRGDAPSPNRANNKHRNAKGGDGRPKHPKKKLDAEARHGHGARKPGRNRRHDHTRSQADRAPKPAGLLARHLALLTTEAVIRDRLSLDRALPGLLTDTHFAGLEPRDKAFARLLAMTVLRRHTDLDRVIGHFLEKPLSADAIRIRLILLAGAAELTLLTVAPHAAISNAVELTRLSPKTAHFDRLTNAILRRVSEKGAELLAETTDPAANLPPWMIAGWQNAYGEETAARIAAASLTEAALDFTLKDPASAEKWAAELEATILPTGTLRRAAGGRIETLPGYETGDWWVQDAAACLPARLLAPAPGDRVLDLCAAPGGKTAQLVSQGADVTAVDVSLDRLERLRANLDRLTLDAHTIAADATTWRGGTPFDHILIDAPCSATGTIRRHPDILHLKRADDTRQLIDVQARLLRNAATQLRPGGTLVYCTCTLEPAECEERVDAFLAAPGARHLAFARKPITPSEVAGQAGWITSAGDLRTFPFDLPNETPALSGLDGFYAARLIRTA
jgi:16S rRNA (cytosine967-C5)-methyltransferase